MQSDFLKKSILERTYLKEIFNRMEDKYEYKSYMTPEEGYDCYDGLLIRFEKETHRVIDQFIIEIKVRDTFYPDLLIERDKLNNLKREQRIKAKKILKDCYMEIPIHIVYISVTPQGTYWFNMNKLEKELVWTREYHNVSTTDKSKGKIMKDVAYISVDKAKKFKLNTGELVDPTIEKEMVEHKKTKIMAGFII